MNHDIKYIIEDIVTHADITQRELRDSETINYILDIVSDMIGDIYDPHVPAYDIIMMKGQQILKEYQWDEVVYRSLIPGHCVKPPSDQILKRICQQLKVLKSMPQHKQRSDAWHVYRNSMITASDLAKAIGMNKYGRPEDLILRKCGIDVPYYISGAIMHGVKYEDVAVKLYEQRNKVVIEEYGCIRHKTHVFLGASPDGICGPQSENSSMIGRMLEIKCPSSRTITGIPPVSYAVQVQAQLEVCDLDYCDFLECKIVEYTRDEYLCDKTMEKGAVMTVFDRETNANRYYYSLFGIDEEDLTKWVDQTWDEIIEKDTLEYLSLTFWRLKKYSCVLLKRSKSWFKEILPMVREFWKKVEYYRTWNEDDLVSKLKKNSDGKKSKRVKKRAFKGWNGSGFLSDMEDDVKPYSYVPKCIVLDL